MRGAALACLLVASAPIVAAAQDEFDEWDDPDEEAAPDLAPVRGRPGGAGDLAPPTPRGHEPPPRRRAEGVLGRTPDEPDEVWRGPRVELGYATFVLADGFGGGRTHGFDFGGYAPLAPARLGGYVEFAGSDYTAGETDVVLRGTALAGAQLTERLARGRLVPYLALAGTLGVRLGKRFHETVSHKIVGGGFELGLDIQIHRTLWGGIAFSYVRAAMDGLSHNLAILRLRVGL